MSRQLYERAVMQLLVQDNKTNYGGKRFYGFFLNSFRKHFDSKNVPTAGVNITNQVNLYINADWFSTLTDEQRVDVLQHECDHIIHYHQSRFKTLDESDHKMWNIACDAAINAPLTSLHELGVTVDKLKKEIPDIEHNQTAEYYYSKLKEYRDKNGGKGGKGESTLTEKGLIDDHDVWGKSEDLSGDNSGGGDKTQIDSISKEIVKRAMKDAVEKCNGRGNVPIEILKIMDELNKASVNWRQNLKQFFARASKFNKKITRMKRNRRYGHLIAGRRKDPQTKIAIGIDNSGSVDDKLFMQFFSEIKAAYNLGGIEFIIIQSDCEVNSVVENYNPKTEVTRTGGGGTAYMPAINKAIELKADGMIYFGDGDIFNEQLTQPKFPFLWAMEDGRDAPAEWGKVCHVKCDVAGGY